MALNFLKFVFYVHTSTFPIGSLRNTLAAKMVTTGFIDITIFSSPDTCFALLLFYYFLMYKSIICDLCVSWKYRECYMANNLFKYTYKYNSFTSPLYGLSAFVSLYWSYPWACVVESKNLPCMPILQICP